MGIKILFSRNKKKTGEFIKFKFTVPNGACAGFNIDLSKTPILVVLVLNRIQLCPDASVERCCYPGRRTRATWSFSIKILRARWHDNSKGDCYERTSKMLYKINLLLLILILLCYVQTIFSNPDAKRLYDDLLSNYNRLIRPVSNNTDTVLVKLGLRLSQLIELVSPRHLTRLPDNHNNPNRFRISRIKSWRRTSGWNT